VDQGAAANENTEETNMPSLTYSDALKKAYRLGQAARTVDSGYEHCPYPSADLAASWRRGFENRPQQDIHITVD
jgi:hypothetical protein